MSSILNQLIRWEANFDDRANAPTKSLRVEFTIEGDDEADDGDNDGKVDVRSDNFEEELVTVRVNVGDPMDFVGEEGVPFFMDSKK